MSKFKKFAAPAAIAAAVASLFSPVVVLAATIDILPSELQPVSNTSLPGVISWIIRLIIIAGFILAFVFLVIGGIRWILAGGDKTKVEGARGQVIGALVGLVIIILAFVIIMFIQSVFKIDVIGGKGNITVPLTPS